MEEGFFLFDEEFPQLLGVLGSFDQLQFVLCEDVFVLAHDGLDLKFPLDHLFLLLNLNFYLPLLLHILPVYLSDLGLQ